MTGSRSTAAAIAETPQVLAARARECLVDGREHAACIAYGELVTALQRRALRLAVYYLRDACDAEDAVQDAFVKAFMHLRSYNDALPFDAWFTRILVNGCLDRLKVRRRQWRWSSAVDVWSSQEERPDPPASGPSPEDLVVEGERRERLAEAIERLPERQRTVMLLTHLDGRSPREIRLITGMNESTIRVHLFRAVRRLRSWLAPKATAERESLEAEG